MATELSAVFHNPTQLLKIVGSVDKADGAAATGGLKFKHAFPVEVDIFYINLVGITSIDVYHVKEGKIITLDQKVADSYGKIRDKMLASSNQKIKDVAYDPPQNFYLYREEAVGGAAAAYKFFGYIQMVTA